MSTALKLLDGIVPLCKCWLANRCCVLAEVIIGALLSGGVNRRKKRGCV